MVDLQQLSSATFLRRQLSSATFQRLPMKPLQDWQERVEQQGQGSTRFLYLQRIQRTPQLIEQASLCQVDLAL
jgi:hypothetical protein